MQKKYKKYITTPLYYVNSFPHIGHTYTTVVTDVVKKYYKKFDKDVFFLTGTDEHGEKIFDSAKKQNKDVDTFVNENSDRFRKLWDFMNIDYDDFIRTTEERHKKIVQYVLKTLYDKGDIYFDSYEGLYCLGCERFVTESELINGKCKDHGVPPKKVKEENYFFKMSKYVEKFKSELEKNPNIIRPRKYYNEVLGYLKENVGDLCISRPKERVSWGIELPFDKNFVTYVWFDALTNYISAIGYPKNKNFDDLWSVSEHFVAKDILRTHTIYWCTMLLALGLPLYKHLNVHGYWNMSGIKMSKSLGNVIDPYYFKEKYGDENLRFFFLRDMHWGDDSDFSLERFITRYNSDLANNYGNLISRFMGMMNKYFKDFKEIELKNNLPEEHFLKSKLIKLVDSYKNDFSEYKFYKTLDIMFNVFDETNKYIAESKPWEIAKNQDKEALLLVLSPVMEVIRITTAMLYPVMPKITINILKEFGIDEKFKFDDFLNWGSVDKIKVQYETKKFFDRIDIEKK
jgi:methionyl-tRNA synthetase